MMLAFVHGGIYTYEVIMEGTHTFWDRQIFKNIYAARAFGRNSTLPQGCRIIMKEIETGLSEVIVDNGYVPSLSVKDAEWLKEGF